MFDRRATVAVTALAAAALGSGVGLASMHGDHHSKAQHGQLRAARPASALVNVHVCRPGVRGSRLDALQ